MSSVLLLGVVYLGAYEKLEMKERCLSLVQIVRCRPKGLHTLYFLLESLLIKTIPEIRFLLTPPPVPAAN